MTRLLTKTTTVASETCEVSEMIGREVGYKENVSLFLDEETIDLTVDRKAQLMSIDVCYVVTQISKLLTRFLLFHWVFSSGFM